MADLSPQLLERRRLRETRSRPWRECKIPTPISPSTRPSLATPTSTPTRRPQLRRCEATLCSRSIPLKTRFRRSGPFPFLNLPFEIQLLVAEYAVQYKQPMKCEDFIPYKDGVIDETYKTAPKRALSKHGGPSWIPLLKLCPWLTKDVARTWYQSNTFYVKTVKDWNAFVTGAGWTNIHRIERLHVDNELIYCPGESIGEGPDWRSHTLLSLMKNLKTLTLYRDDGGPEEFNSGGNDEFNSVEWFVRLATDCKTLEQIDFALYPWTGFDSYPLADSNMVEWIEDWEHEWNAVLRSRRAKDVKPRRSWYLEVSPTADKSVSTG